MIRDVEASLDKLRSPTWVTMIATTRKCMRKVHTLTTGMIRVNIKIMLSATYFFFFQAEDGIRDVAVTGVPDVCSSDLQLSYQLLQILREVYQRRDLHRICVANVQ